MLQLACMQEPNKMGRRSKQEWEKQTLWPSQGTLANMMLSSGEIK